MLKDRLHEQKDLDNEIENEMIKTVKTKIKKGEILLNTGFFNREDFKDKLYLILSSEIEKKYD